MEKGGLLPRLRAVFRFAILLVFTALVAALGYLVWKPGEAVVPAMAPAVTAPSTVPTTPQPTPVGLLPDGRIDINRADQETLMRLPGIGEKRSQAIIDEREINGPYADVDALSRVKNMTVKIIEDIRDLVVAGE